MGEEAHHVHFDEASDGIKNNDIVIKQKAAKKIEIQLGFLQIHHVYEVSFVMSRSVFVADVAGYEQEDEPVPNINCRMAGIEQEDDNVRMVIKFKAVKEKLVREKIVVTNCENDKVCLEFVARVLGKGKGTPMLRSGIKCVEVQQDRGFRLAGISLRGVEASKLDLAVFIFFYYICYCTLNIEKYML